jgi:N-succinyl-L-ornithine transcarbamylase
LKQFLSVNDAGNIDALAMQALQYKANPLVDQQLGANKRIGLLFMNPSLRTRLSTQLAAQNLGMEAIVFNVDKDGWALEFAEGAVMDGTTVEHVKDAAPVLGQYFDILCIRSFPGLKDREEDYSEKIMQAFVRHAGVPIVSLESATLHPLQSLADVVTIQETHSFIKKPKVVLSWAPHIKPLPQCVANSFAEWMGAWSAVDLVVAHPPGLELDSRFTQSASVVHEQATALKDADFVYVKNWSSFNQYGVLQASHEDWMLTNQHLAMTNNAKVMHCLPVRRNVELSDEVLDGSNSLVTQQAGNRVWAAQAVLANILKATK